MNISKFLLIDAGVSITAILLIFILKGRNQKPSLYRSSTKEELLGKTFTNIPEKEKILDLEKHARSQSSGIEFDSLVGNWKFVSIWKKESNDEDSLFSSLLKVFYANLELKKKISPNDLLKFSISASIKFGLFSIRFTGPGYLKGKQPFLLFFFNLIELKLGKGVLLSRSIKEPVEKEKSFLELIASDENERWLTARSQKGQIVLLLKD